MKNKIIKKRIDHKRDDIKRARKKVIKIFIVTLLGTIFLFNAVDIAINFSYKRLPNKPLVNINTDKVNNLLYYLENPDKREEDEIIIDNEYILDIIRPVKQYIDARYDCADFRMPSLLRLEYLYGDYIKQISPQGSEMIKQTFINAKYWMTEPGSDAMCFWSENHQILFATSEYMAGLLWQNEVFTNDGTTGKEHMERALLRIGYWMEHRFKYGFAEFNSANYIPFNIGPMSNFIQFAAEQHRDMAEKMKIIMDLQIYDIASNMYKYTLMAPSARAYASNMFGISGDPTRKYTDFIWGLNEDSTDSRHRMLLNFISMMQATDGEGKPYYEVPQVLLEIGRDNETRITKSSSGLNLSEIEQKGYIGHSDEQIMMQLGMEAFTNPEVIQNTISYFSKYKMFKNYFLNDFKYFNIALIKNTGLLRPISEKLNPMPNGIALQRANIYTYKTPNYQLATAQAYHPGAYGATQMLSIANFTEQAVVFTKHPARHASKKTADGSPGYFAGFGRAPHAVQHENIQLSIYKIPSKSGFLELYDVPQFTHTYLPEAFFDEVIIDGRYAFARVGNAYLSLTGASNLEYLPHNSELVSDFKSGIKDHPDKRFDLIQHGQNQYWIYELSDTAKESFDEFKLRIKSNSIVFDGENNLTYTSKQNTLSLTYGGAFKLNGDEVSVEYKRFDSEYIVAEREAEQFNFDFGGYSLSLNYENSQRIYI